MEYFVYITVDHKRRRFYLGCHYGPVDGSDGYYGSSSAIRNIKRRRPETLTRTVIAVYRSRAEMFAGEVFWGEAFGVVAEPRFYNRTACGYGSFEHLKHQVGEAHPLWGKSHSAATKDRISATKRGRKIWTDEQRSIMSAARQGDKHPMWGRKHSLESIEKNRAANKTAAKESRLQKCASYELIDPDGLLYNTNDLQTFCTEHGLNIHSLKNYAKSGGRVAIRGPNKGWLCRMVSRDSEEQS